MPSDQSPLSAAGMSRRRMFAVTGGIAAAVAGLPALARTAAALPTAAADVPEYAGADDWGLDHDGFIGRLPLPNKTAGSWAEFYAVRRLLPYLKLARDRGAAVPVSEGVHAVVARHRSSIVVPVPAGGPSGAPARPPGRVRAHPAGWPGGPW